MKLYVNILTIGTLISFIAYFGAAEGYGISGGSRGLQQDDVPEAEVPQEFNARVKRAAAADEPPEELPQEIEHYFKSVRHRRSPQMPIPDGIPMPPMPPRSFQ